jgi:hypothetical protein
MTLAADPQPSKKAHAKKKQAPKAATVDEFVQLLLKQGHDYQLFDDRRASMFGFPPDGAHSKAFQFAGDPTVSGKPAHMCNLVLDHGTPVGLVLQIGFDYPELRKSKDWDFQLDLKGSLHRAVTGVGENDAAGKPVPGSAKDKDEDITDPEVQKLANDELQQWLRYAYVLLHPRAPAAKR